MFKRSIGRSALFFVAFTLLATGPHADDKTPETMEEKAARSLERPISLDLFETPFADFVQFLRDTVGVDVVIDHVALRDAALSADTPITLKKNDVPLGTVLAQLLAPHGLKTAVKKDGLHITSSERELETALQQPISIDFTETPFADVLDFIARHARVNIHEDRAQLREIGMEPDLPITLKLDNVTVDRALQLLLEPLDLHAVAVGEVLKITTDECDNMHVKVYPVQDLVLLSSANEHLAARGASLVDTLLTTIEPSTWAEEGGPGTIRFEPLTLSLVVRQALPVHRQIESLLKELHSRKQELGKLAGKDGLPELSAIEQAQTQAVRTHESLGFSGGGAKKNSTTYP